MRCPVCGERLVKFETIENADVLVRCRTDGDFVVTSAAFGKLERAPARARHQALNRAIVAARPGALPRIRKSMVTEDGTGTRVTAPSLGRDISRDVSVPQWNF